MIFISVYRVGVLWYDYHASLKTDFLLNCFFFSYLYCCFCYSELFLDDAFFSLDPSILVDPSLPLLIVATASRSFPLENKACPRALWLADMSIWSAISSCACFSSVQYAMLLLNDWCFRSWILFISCNICFGLVIKCFLITTVGCFFGVSDWPYGHSWSHCRRAFSVCTYF